jgi:peptide/nickel transport system substrate-binding protein
MYGKYCGVPSEEIDVCPSVGWIADFADPQAVLNVAFNGNLITPSGNNNWGQVDVPSINAAMEAAQYVNGEHARAAAWAQIDVALVKQAAAIPFDWEKAASVQGHGVHGVGDLWNAGKWDYSWTSLK